MIPAWVEAWPRDKFFKLRKSKFRELFLSSNFYVNVDIPLLINLFISLIELKNIQHQIKKHTWQFVIDKTTSQSRKQEQRMALAKISL